MAALTFTPGQTISWDDLNAMMAQHGSPQGAKSVVKVEKKPLTKEEREKIEDAGGDPDAPEQDPVYRYFFEDGSWVDARQDSAGQMDAQGRPGQGATFRVADYHPSPKFQAAERKEEATAGAVKEGDTRGPQTGKKREVYRNGAWTVEDNPVYDAKPADPADTVGKPTGNTRQKTEGNTTTKEVEYVLPDGSREWRAQTQTEAATAVDQVGKPTGNTRERTEGGAKVKETEYILPDGKREWRTQTAAGEPAGRKEVPYTDPKSGKQYTRVTETDPTNNRIREYFVDPATGKEVTLDSGANIKGVPSYTPDLTKPGAGLIDRAKQLDELVAAGTITYQQRQEVLKNDQVLASTVANEFNVGVALLREDYQNQTSQRNADVQTANTRLSISNAHMQNALGFVSKFLPYMGQKPGTATNLFTGLLATQVAHATAMGGLKDIPREHMDPALTDYARSRVGAATRPGGAGAPLPPNVIGAGAVPTSIAPGAPTPQQAAITPPFAGDYDVNKYDRGPNGTLVPREFTPSGSRNSQLEGALGLQAPQPEPEDNSWRQQALDRQQVAMAQQLLGGGQQEQPFQLEPMNVEPTGMDFQPLPMVLDSEIPGLTPEIDRLARQELDMALSGGRW